MGMFGMANLQPIWHRLARLNTFIKPARSFSGVVSAIIQQSLRMSFDFYGWLLIKQFLMKFEHSNETTSIKLLISKQKIFY